MKTVSVFIPAYNEEKNIKKLLVDLLSQNQINFTLERILVISDASKDNTVNEISSLNNKSIEIIINKQRMGKWFSFQVAKEKLTSDYIISIDGDTEVKDNAFLIKLIGYLNRYQIVSARVSPNKGTNQWGKIFELSGKMSREIFESSKTGADFYLCHGRCIGFQKEVLMKMTMPKIFGTDAFVYFFAEISGYTFGYAKEAEIYYNPPSSFQDYARQAVRANKVRDQMKKFFPALTVDSETNLKPSETIRVIWKYFLKHPFYTSIYIFAKITVTVMSMFDSKIEPKWQVSISTK